MTGMRTRVKVCGLTTEEEVAAAVDAGVDAVGFVVDVPVDTHREVSVERAHELAQTVPPFVTSVAVTMPSTSSEAGAVYRDVAADVLQIHSSGFTGGGELRSHGVTVLQKAELEGDTPVDADAYIVDSEGEEGRGGTGETADWTLAREFVEDSSLPVVLAGGLTPDNVAEAIEEVEPYGVDVSSGVERRDEKDPGLVREFVDEVRGAEG